MVHLMKKFKYLNYFLNYFKYFLVHDFWIIDSGVIDHMTYQTKNLYDFEKLSKPSQVYVSNGKAYVVLG